MKILFIDLSFGFEDLSIKSSRYGGARIVPAFCREKLDDFYTAGHSDCFNNLKSYEKSQNCIHLTKEQVQDIRDGKDISSIFKDSYDLVMHTCPDVWVNTSIKTLVWCVGFQERVHTFNTNILLHNKNNQQPLLNNNKTRIFEFILGVEIPEFQEYNKEDILFNCNNHDFHCNSHLVAHWCSKYGITGYFAGPIGAQYPLKNFIDDKYTFYLGQITEDVKVDFLKKAKSNVLLLNNQINETPLSVKIAMAYGTFPIVTPVGDFNAKIQHGYNGFLIKNEQEFVNAWRSRNSIKQSDCYKSIEKYSIDNMISSLSFVFSLV